MKKLLLFLVLALCSGQVGAQCTASFTISQNASGNNLLRFYLTNTSVFGTTSGTVIWSSINFGDGTANVYSNTAGGGYSHDYSTPGTYAVGIRINKWDAITNNLICTDTTTQLLTVTWPSCGTTITKINGAGGLVTFTANTPSGTAGHIYTWTFGDGSPSVNGNPVTHTYLNGTYLCYLRDSLPGICSYYNQISVAVTNGAVNCSGLSSDMAYIVANGKAMFTALSTTQTGLTRHFYWDFGDGNTLLNQTISQNDHNYSPGTYNVKLRTVWTDNSNLTYCQDSIVRVLTVVNCGAYTASFTSAVTANSVTFTNTSTAAVAPAYKTYHWDFGDGSPVTTTVNPTHTYTAVGTYTVKLMAFWDDSISHNHCMDSILHNVVIGSIPPPSGPIYGSILYDSVNHPGIQNFMVYLIKYDSLTTTLSLADSQTAQGVSWINYGFQNKPAGRYFVKAAMLGQPVGTAGCIPTYHDSALYWSNAQAINHPTGTNYFYSVADIYMRSGTVTSGPGFVGGNVSLGANKGNSSGVPRMAVYLRRIGNAIVKAAITDANGDFSFQNIPTGTYNVYPEQMNYATTPYANIVVTNASATVTGINFNQDNNQKNIKPRGTSVGNVPVNSSFKIYPNPANDKVTLIWTANSEKAVNVMITDIAGRIIVQQQMDMTSGKEQSLDISHLSSGTYFLKMHAAQGDLVQQIAIRH